MMHDGSGQWDGVGGTLPFVCEWESENDDPDFMVYNGHSYSFFPSDLTWYEAKDYCESLGGHLVTISDENEN